MSGEEKILSDYTVSASSIVMGLIVVTLSWLATINMTEECCDNDMHIKFQILLTIGMVNVLIGATGWLDGDHGHPIISFIYFIISSVILFTIGGTILSEENAEEGCSDKVKNYTYGIIGMGVGIVAVHALSLYGHYNIWRKKSTVRAGTAALKLKKTEADLKIQEADLKIQEDAAKKSKAKSDEANRAEEAEAKFSKAKIMSEAKDHSKRTKLTNELFENACDIDWKPHGNSGGVCVDVVFEKDGEGDVDTYKSNIADATKALNAHKRKEADALSAKKAEAEATREKLIADKRLETYLEAEEAKKAEAEKTKTEAKTASAAARLERLNADRNNTKKIN